MNRFFRRLFRRLTVLERMTSDIEDTKRELYTAKTVAHSAEWNVRFLEDKLARLHREQSDLLWAPEPADAAQPLPFIIPKE